MEGTMAASAAISPNAVSGQLCERWATRFRVIVYQRRRPRSVLPIVHSRRLDAVESLIYSTRYPVDSPASVVRSGDTRSLFAGTTPAEFATGYTTHRKDGLLLPQKYEFRAVSLELLEVRSWGFRRRSGGPPHHETQWLDLCDGWEAWVLLP